MEERFSFKTPDSEPDAQAQAELELSPFGQPESYRQTGLQTEVYRLPDQWPLLAPPQPNQITGKQAIRHLLWGIAAIITTVMAGTLLFGTLKYGVMYSFTILTILTAHEFGHYIACRWYGVEATLPYFIPFVIPLSGTLQAGTFGAFIKIKSPIPSRRALFDIGIAGPLAGFVFAIPATFIAHHFAQPSPFVEGDSFIQLQDPLLFTFFQRAMQLPRDLLLNPVMWAAWIGLLMTALNLMPVGQLDGGHVTYALFGRRGHRAVAAACYVGVIALVGYSIYNQSWSYILYAVILTLMMRGGHPPVVDEQDSLGTPRILVALIGLLIFALCFMPFPVKIT